MGIFGDIHRRLYEQEDISKINFVQHLKDNLQNLIIAYNIDMKNIDLDLDIANPDITLDEAVTCGLLLNELISNSLKHAFVSQGKISVSIIRSPEGVIEKIIYADNGKGIKPEADGFGMNIIFALAEQLKMTASISANDGTRFDFIRRDNC